MGGGFGLLLGHELDHIVDSEDSDGSLGGETEGVDLRDHGLQDSSLQVVTRGSLGQIQTTVFEVQSLLVVLAILLGSSMQSSQLRDQLSGILSSIDCQSFGDDVECFAEFLNSQLLLGVEGSAELIEVDAESDIDGSSSSNNLS